MLACLWHAGLIIASHWGAGDFLESAIPQFLPNSKETGALGGAAIGAGEGALLTRGNPVGEVVGGPLGAVVGADKERGEQPKRAVVAADNAQIARQMTLEEIVLLAQVGQKDAVIIDAINSTGSVFLLAPDDVDYLRQQRVSDAVINHMRLRRYVRLQPAPVWKKGELFGVDFSSNAQPASFPPPPMLPVDVASAVSNDNPPDLSEILRALPPVPPGIPYIYDEYRDNVEFSTAKVVDRVGPPMFIPLVGMVQVHRCQWKCTVNYTQTTAYPLIRMRRTSTEILYIDKNRLQAVANDEPAVPALPMSCPAGAKATPRIVASAEGNAETSEPPVFKPARMERSHRLSIDDVINLSKHGLSEKIILRQIEMTNAVFELSADDLIRLHDEGVSEAVISTMQESRWAIRLR